MLVSQISLNFNYVYECLDLNIRNPALTAEQVTDDYRMSTISTMTNDTGSTISSTSLTQVSDISDEPKITQNANVTSSSQASVKADTSGQISTTDVILEEVALDTKKTKAPSFPISPMRHSSSDEGSPPPLPSSEPPALDDDTFNNKFQFGKKL